MVTTGNPSKQQVREYLSQRLAAHTPPPSPEEVRRQLGWPMLHPKPGESR